MIDSAILIALIVAIPTVLASTFTPLATALMATRARRREKLEDYARQDLVAERAAEVSATLLLRTKERAEETKITNEKLDTIHTLVNSNMTAAMQAELDATIREKALIIELMSLKKLMDQEIATETVVALKAANDKISELTAVLRDRLT